MAGCVGKAVPIHNQKKKKQKKNEAVSNLISDSISRTRRTKLVLAQSLLKLNQLIRRLH